MSHIEVELDEMRDLFEKMKKAGTGDFRKALEDMLEDIGDRMLDIFAEEIRASGTIDTGRLLKSFEKGEKNNIYVLNKGDLTIEVGTSVEYAMWVNDGHWSNPQGVERRWVPGYWEGKHFEYVPGAKTGMSLKQQWVEGKHYAEATIRAIENVFPGWLDRKLNEWFESYF